MLETNELTQKLRTLLHPRAALIAYSWKSHATLTLLATQDCPLWLQYD